MPSSLPRHPNSPGLFRIESWEDGLARHVLVMAQDCQGTPAWLLSCRHDGTFAFGSGEFDANLSPDVIRYPREAIAAALPTREADQGDLWLFGLKHEEDITLRGNPARPLLVDEVLQTVINKEQLASAATPYARAPRVEHVRSVMAERAPSPAIMALRKSEIALRSARLLGRREDPVVMPPRWGFNWQEPAWPEAQRVRLRKGVTGPRPDADVIHDLPRNDPAGLVREIERLFREAMQPILEAVDDPRVAEIVSDAHWSPKLHAFYAAPGETGERRRQAGRLYPALAPIIAHDPEIVRLVDAGKPFEEALCRAMRKMQGDDGLHVSVAALRRMRTLANDTPFRDLGVAARAAARLPVDWVPTTPEAWKACIEALPPFIAHAEALHVDLGDLIGGKPQDWAELTRRFYGEEPDDALQAQELDPLFDAQDPLRRLAENLLRPVAGLVALEEGGVPLADGPEDEDLSWLHPLAGELLYRGKSFTGILKLSTRWHQGLNLLEALMPRQESTSSWPALFKPYTAFNGVRVVPLTTPLELAEEGSKHPDSNGVPGLSHCVGGYGKDCYSGTIHILSFRKPLEGGGYERLSTAELGFDENQRWSAPLDIANLKVVQHRGHSNRIAPQEAQRAMIDVMGALRGETNRTIAVNPDALMVRSRHDFDKGYDWSDPGQVGQALAAWAPYLPADVVRAGVEGLKERVRPAIREMLGLPGRDLSLGA